MAMGLLRASRSPPFAAAAPPLFKIAPGDFVAPGLCSAVRARTQYTQSMVKYAGAKKMAVAIATAKQRNKPHKGI